MYPALFDHQVRKRRVNPRLTIQAAEKAAEAGDYAAAEHLLREAARLQEASPGQRQSDLANTLNSLAIVCEIAGKPADAEQYFRRAASIATASLPPDHPFVVTSQKNLRDFCEARGTPVDPPSEGHAPEPVGSAAAPPQSGGDPEQEDPEVTSRKFFHRLALGALGPIAMLMVVLAVGLPRLGAPELAYTSPLPVPAPVEPMPASRESSMPAQEREDAEGPVVVRASLCGDLVDWACDPADRPVPPGPLFFYTRIKSPNAISIEHRWYQDDRLHQTVKLHVEASRAEGYRTYSRSVMTSDSIGHWRVELRSENGALLHEERFTVR